MRRYRSFKTLQKNKISSVYTMDLENLSKKNQNKLVFGYLHECEMQLCKPTCFIYNNIPSCIMKLCFSYYYLGSGEIERCFKCVLLGAAGVGKSSIVMSFDTNQFDQTMPSTIGAMFREKTMIVDEYTIQYRIWDTAGQERFNSIMPMYYRDAHIIIFVYDVTNDYSLERAKKWMDEIEEQYGTDMIFAIAANKWDLKGKYDGIIDHDAVKEYAIERGASFFETSAKNNWNIAELFAKIGYRAAKTITPVDRVGAIDNWDAPQPHRKCRC
eukprot:540324_1